MPGERRGAGRWRRIKLNDGKHPGLVPVWLHLAGEAEALARSYAELSFQGDLDADGLRHGGRRGRGWTLVLYTGYDWEACPFVVCWTVSPLVGKTTDWRAGCGRSASPVRREGEAKASPYPYQ